MQNELIKFRAAVNATLAKSAKAVKQAEQDLSKVMKKAEQDVEKAKGTYNAAHEEHTRAAAAHAKLDEFFPEKTVKAKPGPKAKVAKVVAAPKKPGPKVKAKPGPKAKVVAAPKVKAKPGPKPKAVAPKAAGPKKTRKKADGSMTMVESLIAVIGNKIMSASDMVEGLTAMGKATVSKDLKGYTSSVLSSALDKDGKRVFVAVERGKYCVAANRKTAVAVAPKAAAAPKAPKAAAPKAAAPKAAAPKAAAPKVAAPKVAAAAPVAPVEVSSESPADKLISEMGMDPTAFGGSAVSAPLS